MTNPHHPRPLDPSFYNLQDSEAAFYSTQTGIQDDEELRAHILGVQAEAYAIYPYPCIRSLSFTRMKMSKYPSYNTVLKIGRENPDAILLDLGCCFGNDVRKAIADGYPLDKVIASDLRLEFWALGHKLFRSSQESFPVPFIAGDIFDHKFLAPNILPAPTSNNKPSPPPLTAVTSLTQLLHHVSVIHTSAFFHLFSERQQHNLAHLLGSLLSPLPGSMIFGSHVSAENVEDQNGGQRLLGSGATTFAHTPSSWEKLWAGENGVFSPADVKLSTRLVEIERKDIVRASGDVAHKSFLLVWTVTRI